MLGPIAFLDLVLKRTLTVVTVIASPFHPLSEKAFQYLAIIILRQAVDEHVLLGALEAGNVILAEPVQLRAGGRRIPRADDIGDDDFSPFPVPAADYGYLGYAAVPEEHLFNFSRIDIGAPRDDEIFGAVFKSQEPVLIQDAIVARV